MEWDVWWLAYPLLGAVVGFFAGLLGIGGGGITVPMLTTLFLYQGFSSENTVRMALGTSMAAIVLTSLSSMRAHHAHAAVRWDIFRGMVPGIVFGTFSGTFVAALIPGMPLAIFFCVFMGYVSLMMMTNLKPRPSRTLPGKTGLAAVGLGIGGVSSLVAIGGGVLMVPFMTWCNVDVRKAIGTSAAIGFPLALSGALGYLWNGWSMHDLPRYSAGFIYLPALILMTMVSVVTAPVGARLAHRLPVPILKKVFACILLLLCAKMLYNLKIFS